jgi:hypothetical protein
MSANQVVTAVQDFTSARSRSLVRHLGLIVDAALDALRAPSAAGSTNTRGGAWKHR